MLYIYIGFKARYDSRHQDKLRCLVFTRNLPNHIEMVIRHTKEFNAMTGYVKTFYPVSHPLNKLQFTFA